MMKLLLHESKRRVGSPDVFITPGTYFIICKLFLQFGDGAIYTPRRGLAVIFTSGEENLHRVTPVMWGMRRALTMFLSCDKSFSITNSFL